MLLLIDNYDSFVHNLARYFERLGQETRVIRNDALDVAGIRRLAARRNCVITRALHTERRGRVARARAVDARGSAYAGSLLRASSDRPGIWWCSRARRDTGARASVINSARRRGIVSRAAIADQGRPISLTRGGSFHAARIASSDRLDGRRRGDGIPITIAFRCLACSFIRSRF